MVAEIKNKQLRELAQACEIFDRYVHVERERKQLWPLPVEEA